MTKPTWKQILPVLCGDALETYDFVLYGLLAPIFAIYFFSPQTNKVVSLILSFGLFSLAYIARPLGVLFWGYIADKKGRKPVLIGTLIVMTIPAIGMVCVPSYKEIGVTASILVVIFRLFQGFAFGGEFSTSMVVLYELAPKNKKGLYTSLNDTLAQIGQIVAMFFVAIFSTFLPQDVFFIWGWKLLFLFSIVFIFAAKYIRFNLPETLNITKIQKISTLNILKENWQPIIKIILFMATANILFFSFIFHSQLILKENPSSYTNISWMQLFNAIYLIILYPIMGHLSDLIGREKFVKLILSLLIIFIFPIYKILLIGNIYCTICGSLCLGIFVSGLVGTFVPLIVTQAKDYCRVTVVGLGHSISLIIFGSTAPMINEILIKETNNHMMPAFYLFVAAIVSLMTVYWMQSKFGENYEHAILQT